MRVNTSKASLYLGMHPEAGPEQGKENACRSRGTVVGGGKKTWNNEPSLDLLCVCPQDLKSMFTFHL